VGHLRADAPGQVRDAVVLGAERLDEPPGVVGLECRRETAVALADGCRGYAAVVVLQRRVEPEEVVAELLGEDRPDVPVALGVVDAVEFPLDLDAGAGRHHDVAVVVVLERPGHRGPPAVDAGFLGVLDAVDLVEEQEVGVRVGHLAEHAVLVVPDGPDEPFVRAELVQRVGVEGDVAEPFRLGAVGEAVVDELLYERGLAHAVVADQPEQRLVLELAVARVGAGEVVVVAPPSGRQAGGEGRRALLPPGVVVVERGDQRVVGAERHDRRLLRGASPRRAVRGHDTWSAGSDIALSVTGVEAT